MPIKNQTPHWPFSSLFNQIIYARRGNNNHILNFVRYYIINIYIWKCKVVRTSPAASLNFCTVWWVNSDIYLYLPTFWNTLSNRLSIFSPPHLNIIYLFFLYYFLIFFYSSLITIFFKFLTAIFLNFPIVAFSKFSSII